VTERLPSSNPSTARKPNKKSTENNGDNEWNQKLKDLQTEKPLPRLRGVGENSNSTIRNEDVTPDFSGKETLYVTLREGS
jgi:hypothetical protein